MLLKLTHLNFLTQKLLHVLHNGLSKSQIFFSLFRVLEMIYSQRFYRSTMMRTRQTANTLTQDITRIESNDKEESNDKLQNQQHLVKGKKRCTQDTGWRHYVWNASHRSSSEPESALFCWVQDPGEGETYHAGRDILLQRSHTRGPTRAFCAAHKAFWEFSNSYNLINLVYSPVFKSARPSSEEVLLKRTWRRLEMTCP